MVVVVRYYGGVKLGTGGLVRAYGGTAAECLRTAPKCEVRPRLPLRVGVPFEHLSSLYHLLSQFDTEKGQEDFTAQGVEVVVQVYPEDEPGFIQALRDATRGGAVVDS